MIASRRPPPQSRRSRSRSSRGSRFDSRTWRTSGSRAILTRAPGNGAAIGGLKVVTENAWFAARPSGTEAIYKIYAESFRGPSHLARVLEEAQSLVTKTLAAGPQ